MTQLCHTALGLRGFRPVAMARSCLGFSSKRSPRVPPRPDAVPRLARSAVLCNLGAPSSNGGLGQLTWEALPALLWSATCSLTPVHAGVIAAAGVLMAALARRRAAHYLVVLSLHKQALPGWTVLPPGHAFIREDILVLAGGLAFLLCWGLWRVLKQGASPAQTRVASEQPSTPQPPPSPGKGESEEVRRLKNELHLARQEASETKHRLRALEQAWQESGGVGQPGGGSRGSNGGSPPWQRTGLELARAESKSVEARVARMEAQEAREELERARQEAQELSIIMDATLESIASEGEDEEGGVEVQKGSRGPAEAAGANGDGSRLLAAASILQSKVAQLKQRADAATALLEEKCRLKDQLREADMAISSLTHDLSTLKWEAQHTHDAMDSLQRHMAASQKENRGLKVAVAKAERHLDAYDKMVLRLEDECEALQDEREQLRARLRAVQGETARIMGGGGGGANGSACVSAGGGRDGPEVAWGLNGAGAGAGTAAA